MPGGDDTGGDGNGGTTPPAPSTLVDGCADLDTDGVADCTVTLVQNPSFTSDVDGWTAMAGATWMWDPQNALDDTPSGSGKLTVETPRGSAVQCVPLTSTNEIIVAWANVFVEPPDDDSAHNQADVSATFFTSSDCSGVTAGSFEAPASDVKGAWSVVNAGGVPLMPIGSVSVALNAIKDTPAASASVYFDNVMLETKPTQ